MTPQRFQEAVESYIAAHEAIRTPLTAEERAVVFGLAEHVLACWQTTPPTPQPCFWCPTPSIRVLNGVALCESHAMCASCLSRLTTTALTCRCEHEGYQGHEELLYCSLHCVETSHPESEPLPIFDDQEAA